MGRDREREIALSSLFKKIKRREWEKRKKEKDAEVIWRRGEIIGNYIFCYHFAHSTMALAKEYIKTEYSKGNIPYSGTVFIAKSLSKAKGRYGRIWYATLGGLWFTLLLYQEIEPPYTHLYPLIAGIACCETIREIGINAHIKWVNDLMVNGRKIGGILTETYIAEDPYLLLGIGINVNNDLPSNLDVPAISIKSILKKIYNIDSLFCLLLTKLIWYVGLLHQIEIEMNTARIIQIFTEYSDTIGRIVYYGEDIKNDRGKVAKVLGIDPYGGLNIKLYPEGEIATVYTGELKYFKEKLWLE